MSPKTTHERFCTLMIIIWTQIRSLVQLPILCFATTQHYYHSQTLRDEISYADFPNTFLKMESGKPKSSTGSVSVEVDNCTSVSCDFTFSTELLFCSSARNNFVFTFAGEFVITEVSTVTASIPGSALFVVVRATGTILWTIDVVTSSEGNVDGWNVSSSKASLISRRSLSVSKFRSSSLSRSSSRLHSAAGKISSVEPAHQHIPQLKLLHL